jgi:hypothetical protein
MEAREDLQWNERHRESEHKASRCRAEERIVSRKAWRSDPSEPMIFSLRF